MTNEIIFNWVFASLFCGLQYLWKTFRFNTLKINIMIPKKNTIQKYFSAPKLKPQIKTKKIEFKDLSDKDQELATQKLISVNVFASSLLHELNVLKRLGMVDSFPLIINFIEQFKSIEAIFKEKLKKDHKVNEKYFKDKLRAIENINFMLINNDDAIIRTEKFIESILTKKR